MFKVEAFGLCYKCHKIEGKLTYIYQESEWLYGYLCEKCHKRIKHHLKLYGDNITQGDFPITVPEKNK